MTIAGDTQHGKPQRGGKGASGTVLEVGVKVGETPTLWHRISHDWLVVGIILLTATGSFGFGLLAHSLFATSSKGDGLWIENLTPLQMKGAVSDAPSTTSEIPSSTVQIPVKKSAVVPKQMTPVIEAAAQSAAAVTSIPSGGGVVAAKTGKNYYLPWCGSVKRIKEENRVWFASAADAEKAGYTPSKVCKGL